ncbi:calcium/sodium antiporter [Candidatus Microgenomates bacterium]|nr:calcium/sodium antiporter [Candidatus Microgenomates bacterium]
MAIFQIILLIFFSIILIKAAEWVIVALRRIAKKTHTGAFAISAIILAIGTSLPELFVGITSSLEGAPNIALGVVLGSNIANIALVTGIIAVIVGRINIHGDYLKRDVGLALVAGLLPLGLMADGVLGRVDGLILLSVYIAYASSFFKQRFSEIVEEHKKEGFFYRFWKQINHIDFNGTREYGRLFVGIALLLFSGEMIVKNAQLLASSLGIPIFVIGVVVLAIGTSLPELAFSLRSVEDKHPSMFFGNLLGSTIANSTLIVGITSLITPIKVVAFQDYTVAVFAFIIIFSVFWLFIRSKHRLERWEGAVLILMYLIFVVVEFVL